jgi:hypothetical protein
MNGCECIRTIQSETLSIKVWVDSSEETADDIETCIASLVEDAERYEGWASRIYLLFTCVTRVEVTDDCGCGESLAEG